MAGCVKLKLKAETENVVLINEIIGNIVAMCAWYVKRCEHFQCRVLDLKKEWNVNYAANLGIYF